MVSVFIMRNLHRRPAACPRDPERVWISQTSRGTTSRRWITCQQSFILLLFSAFQSLGYAWNAQGHALIADIAWQSMHSKTKAIISQSLYPQALYYNAAWMDRLPCKKTLCLKQNHYIDYPYSPDGTKGMPPAHQNALTMIHEAQEHIKQRTQTAFYYKILLHVVGDIHQPLHTVSLYSKRHPYGDRGGNDYVVFSPIGNNLHTYWDKGGGYLTKPPMKSSEAIHRKALAIHAKYPCPSDIEINPKVWAKEAHRIAIGTVYNIPEYSRPSKAYKKEAKAISEKQIAMAGCRLAALLDRINDD